MIESALTAEEWAGLEFKFDNGDSVRVGNRGLQLWDGEDQTFQWLGYEEHKLAALALYGQPFGFTRADVQMLRNLDRFGRTLVGDGARDLADRIEALLPPEA